MGTTFLSQHQHTQCRYSELLEQDDETLACTPAVEHTFNIIITLQMSKGND